MEQFYKQGFARFPCRYGSEFVPLDRRCLGSQTYRYRPSTKLTASFGLWLILWKERVMWRSRATDIHLPFSDSKWQPVDVVSCDPLYMQTTVCNRSFNQNTLSLWENGQLKQNMPRQSYINATAKTAVMCFPNSTVSVCVCPRPLIVRGQLAQRIMWKQLKMLNTQLWRSFDKYKKKIRICF